MENLNSDIVFNLIPDTRRWSLIMTLNTLEDTFVSIIGLDLPNKFVGLNLTYKPPIL